LIQTDSDCRSIGIVRTVGCEFLPIVPSRGIEHDGVRRSPSHNQSDCELDAPGLLLRPVARGVWQSGSMGWVASSRVNLRACEGIAGPIG
jgi:hypothetical protein